MEKETTNKTNKVTIDNREYTVKSLKFGDQRKLAKIIAEVLSGLKYDAAGAEGGSSIRFDLAAIMLASVDRTSEIVAIGLGIDQETVDNFENSEEVMTAYSRILELNRVDQILGKSIALLSNLKV